MLGISSSETEKHLKMAEGLTDHVWSLEEMFTFRVPVLVNDVHEEKI
ncbi:MAG: hypothetical protein MOIL_01218 [Candidatus Methanolliviera sp. GoM_oil]|nr:MAG: hypothetical protein MOIL_01218 [Candidatus Methanolliviera sp. GoM_oil]